MKPSPFGLIALILLATNSWVHACPVCFAAEEDTRGAFLFTTILLSCLPWLMVVAFLTWYRLKTSKEQDRKLGS